MDAEKLVHSIKEQWDIPGLLSDFRKVKWAHTEPGRIDRMMWVGAYDTIRSMAQNAFPAEEWKKAIQDDFDHELVDEYMETLAEVIMDAMGKELRREHVYATFEDGNAFIGQYEDIPAEELRAMGFEVEG